MRKSKKILALAMAAMMAAGLVGCGSSNTDSAKDTTNNTEVDASDNTEAVETKDVSLLVWGPQEDQAPVDGYDGGILKAMCETFNEEHPEWNITFEYGVCSEGDAKDVVTKDVASAADVYMFANDQIPVLVDAGALAQLGGTTVDNLKADQAESMVGSVTYNDGIYGVPFTSNTWFMYYDTSKYTEDEVKSLDAMMAKDLGSGVTNFAFPIDNSWYIASFYYAAGCTLYGDGTDVEAGCDFDNENGVAVTKYLVDLAANKNFSCEKEGSSIAKFQEGKLGAYCSGSWDAEAIKEALGENFGVTKIPTININGEDCQMKSFAGSKAIGVNPQCSDPEVAVALAAYLAGEECQQIRFETRGIIPTNINVTNTETVQADAVAGAQGLEINEASIVQPMLSEMGTYWTPAETMGKEINQGDVNADNAADKTASMVKGILGK